MTRTEWLAVVLTTGPYVRRAGHGNLRQRADPESGKRRPLSHGSYLVIGLQPELPEHSHYPGRTGVHSSCRVHESGV